MGSNPSNKLYKPEVKISDNININNPNLSIPAEPLARGLTQENIGKNSSEVESSSPCLDLPSRQGKGKNDKEDFETKDENSLKDVNTTDNENLNSNEEVPEFNCVAFSMEEPFNVHDSIFNLLMSNYILHLTNVYLFLTLAIILGSTYIINKDIKLLFIQKLLGKTVYDILFKIIKMYSKFNIL